MKNTLRTFVAVEVGDAVRQRAVELIQMLGVTEAAVKWVERHNLHITMKFLDEVPTREIPRVCEAVAQGAAAVTPFELEVRDAGAFPSAGRPRTVWLGAGEGEEQMIALHGQIEKHLAKLGFRKDSRRFHPHLTLGRVRGAGPEIAALGKLLQQHAAFDAGRCRIAEAVVFSSELGREGPTYQALSRAKLG
jgi:RNA 2',3'-cyclic 3'-phosphodiesterase